MPVAPNRTGNPPSGIKNVRSKRFMAWAVLKAPPRRKALMRGPYGIVGLIVTVIVIYLVLHLLGVI